MEIRQLLRNWVFISIVSLLLPPLGLVLLWARPKTPIGRKILYSLPILILGFFSLHFIFGLRVETDGTGISPRFVSYEPERHYAQLEENRSHQPQTPPPAEPSESSTSDSTLALSSPVLKANESPQNHVAPSQLESKIPGQPGNTPYWTDFRGPHRDGRYDETPVLAEWPKQGPPLVWRQPIGGGYASFVIANGRAYTIEQRRTQEVVAAYDLRSGKELWTNAWGAEFKESMGGDGPRATPTWEAGRIYALGALGELRCLDSKTGMLLWNKNILADNQAQNLTWGMSASPLIVDDKLIVLPGGPSGHSVVAYDKLTGQRLWNVLDDKQAYTSPMLVTLNGRRQILVVSAQRIMGLDPVQGRLLWEFPWTTEYGINSSQPLMVNEKSFVISAGYGHGAALVEIGPTDSGFSARAIWQNTSLKNKFSSSVFYQGHIYGMDEAILTCLVAATGERSWKEGRYGYGQLLLAGGSLIVLSEYGELAQVKATPEAYRQVTAFPALEGKTWNHPAIGEGYLLVRNTTEMACYRIAP